MAEPETDRQLAAGSKQASLRMWDVVSLMVGIVVGVSIFKVPGSVFALTGSPELALGIWAGGAFLAFCGALCYAELAAAYPEFGAEYIYLARAYGRRCAFLFAWLNVCAVLPGNIGAASFVFAGYAGQLSPRLAHSPGLVAAGAILALMLLQFAGMVAGRRVQNILTGTKVIALAAILLCGLLLPAAPAEVRAPPAPLQWNQIGLALVFVLYAYGGWNDAATVTPEVRDCRRNVPRALLLGLTLIAGLYLALNYSFLRVLGFNAASASEAPAAELMHRALGPAFSTLMSLIVMASALGAINGMMFSGCRLLAAVGEDFRLFRGWNYWNRRQVPVWSLLTIAGISLLLTVLVGLEAGRGGIGLAAQTVGLAAPDWEKYGGGFNMLVAASAPLFWAFFMLSGVSLIVLRFRDSRRERPFRTPAYPLPAFVFIVSAGFMLWSSLSYAGLITLLLLPALVSGLVLAAIQRPLKQEDSSLRTVQTD
ncbi:APC family permease [Planctomicrobium piriforme]|uniref:Amino acid transporter n=1 Tax=Planctomicrobium piriforme TaxID=1576369 RepID=A0A1I3F880_9PLAN|nr:amino acid permease [Planctomicrobium piriforme]SFI07383.1 Amino acid transporter [Planctomicrobium piriforme]